MMEQLRRMDRGTADTALVGSQMRRRQETRRRFAALRLCRHEHESTRRAVPLSSGSADPAVTSVALVVTIGEPGCDFPQVSLPDRLTAQRTEGLWARCPAIDQNEFHAATLNIQRRDHPSLVLS